MLIIQESVTGVIIVLSRCYTKMLTQYRYLGYFKVKVNRDIDWIPIIRKLERKGLFLQPIPCTLVIHEKVIEIAAKFAIEDFEKGYNRAKKVSTEFLIRLTGRSQIKEAIQLISSLKVDVYYFVLFCTEDGDIHSLDRAITLVKEEIGDSIEFNAECTPDLNEIKKMYNINEDKELRSVRRPNSNFVESLLKLVLERIALAPFK